MEYIDMSIITDPKFKDSQTEALMLYIVASHSDVPINERLYTRYEFSTAVDTWIEPFQKPVLLHHEDHVDAVGRVVEQYYIQSEDWQVKSKQITGKTIKFPKNQSGAVLLKAYITDAEQIDKIKKGIYTTVSVGMKQEKLLCSYCGKDIHECPHIPGEKIDNETVYYVPQKISFQEVSFVNKPADKYAGIVLIEDTTIDEAMKNIKKEVMVEDKVVNSDLIVDNESASNFKEVEDMDFKDELIQAQKQIKELQDKYDALQKHKDELKDKYDELEKLFKDQFVDKVVSLKMILEGSEDSELEKSLKEKYADYDIEQLKMLEDELSSLVTKLIDKELDSNEENDKPCENCDEEGKEQPVKEPKDEEENTTENENVEDNENKEKEKVEDKEKTETENDVQDNENTTNDDVNSNFEKPTNPQKFSFEDSDTVIRKFLGI